MLPWILCAILALAAAALGIKCVLLRRSFDAICAQFRERLATDTNNLISLPSRDRRARRLAAEINAQLRLLRQQRRRYLDGDRELKEAVTNISHDLRTPLTAICGYLELMEQEELSEDAARYLGYIRDRAQALTQLTEELFRYSVVLSTQGSLNPEPVSLNAALEEALAGYYAALTQRGIAPDIRIPEEPVVRQLDRTALARVLGNLLSNALKYSGGDLAVTLSNSGDITFTNAAPDLDGVQVGRLFHRFFTVESAQNSTGLGLSIAKALTEEMGGQIDARWEQGRLTITLRFPA